MQRSRKVLSSVVTQVGVAARLARTLSFVLLVCFAARVDAADHPVTNDTDLRTAIASAVDGDTITFLANVTLTQDLPAIQTEVTVLGNGWSLDGAGTYRGFFIVRFVAGVPAPVNVAIQDLTIQNTRARGGFGLDNAGGGAGLGGALFVATLATTTLSNVQLENNSARGGIGGVDGIFGGGGGGGLGGAGGGGTGGGGGGIGEGASGGNGGLGGDGSSGIMVGLAPGGDGAGGGFGSGGSDGGGGGGGGGTDAGGGGGGIAGASGIGGIAGSGGFGGGGGGAGNISSNGGSGGFGGGGGASGVSGGSLTGAGGFGGGGAGGAVGGFGGGDGAVSIGFPGGGGGAGMGGALFVQQGGSVTLAGTLTINGNSVIGGAVFDAAAGAGSAFGSGIFLQGNGGPLTFTPGPAETQTVANEITDETGSGGTGTRGLTKSGAGTLTLSATNTYSGATTVIAGTLLVDGAINSPVTVNSGGTLGGAGTITNTVAVDSGGTLNPGNPTAILNTGSVSLTAGSTLTLDLNGATPGSQYDRVNVTGGVTLGNATLNVVLGFAPSAGQTFTIVANDLVDAVTGTFAGLPEGTSFTAGAGRFRISYVGGSGNDVTLTAIAPPTISKGFSPSSIQIGATTTLTFTLTNPNPTTALTGVGFSDPLPGGLLVATPNGLANTCAGAVNAAAGGGSVGVTGVSLPAGGSCTMAVDVTGVTAGSKNNTTTAVTSNEGGTGATAAASLAVVGPPTVAKAFGLPSLALNATTTLTFTVTNPAGNGAALTGVGFTDLLPAGLMVATPNGLTGSCSGGTITATAGSTSVVLEDATLNAGTSCVFGINVLAVAEGTQVNTTSVPTSANGGSGSAAATASITVTGAASAEPIPALSNYALAILAMLMMLIGVRRLFGT